MLTCACARSEVETPIVAAIGQKRKRSEPAEATEAAQAGGVPKKRSRGVSKTKAVQQVDATVAAGAAPKVATKAHASRPRKGKSATRNGQ